MALINATLYPEEEPEQHLAVATTSVIRQLSGNTTLQMIFMLWLQEERPPSTQVS